MGHFWGLKINIHKICSLGISEIVPDNRVQKEGKSDCASTWNKIGANGSFLSPKSTPLNFSLNEFIRFIKIAWIFKESPFAQNGINWRFLDPDPKNVKIVKFDKISSLDFSEFYVMTGIQKKVKRVFFIFFFHDNFTLFFDKKA